MPVLIAKQWIQLAETKGTTVLMTLEDSLTGQRHHDAFRAGKPQGLGPLSAQERSVLVLFAAHHAKNESLK